MIGVFFYVIMFYKQNNQRRGVIMNYKSTRGGEVQNSTFATLHGLANGGGLYIPENLPEV